MLRVAIRVASWSTSVLLTALSTVATVWNPFQIQPIAPHSTDRAVIEILSSNADQRVVRHRAGITTIAAHPVRICGLAFVDELLTLGVKPLAVPSDWRGEVQDYLSPYLQRVQLVPQAYASWLPSFEAIAAVRPDLILAAPADLHDYQQLSSIAPTIVLRDAETTNHENSSIDALKRRLRDLGAVLGKNAEAQRAITEFDNHVAQARAAIGDSMRGKTIAFFRTREREWRLYGRRGDNGAEAIYDALGLQAPKMVSDRGLTALDPESLIGFDVDYLIVVGDDTIGARQTLNRVYQDPLWQRVTAVRQHHILEITTYRHWVASGLLGKTRMINEFVQCIRGGRV